MACGLESAVIWSKEHRDDPRNLLQTGSLIMKIYSVEIETDLGRRVVQLAGPLDVEPQGDMPSSLRALTEILWRVLCEVAAQAPALSVPKAEA